MQSVVCKRARCAYDAVTWLLQVAKFVNCLPSPIPWRPLHPHQRGHNTVHYWLALVANHLYMTSWSESLIGNNTLATFSLERVIGLAPHR